MTASGTGLHQARPVDLRAAIHHNEQTGIARPLRRCLVDHAELHPNRLGPDRDRLVDVLTGELAAPKDVDDLYALAERAKVREAFLAEDFAGAEVGVHGDHTLAALLKERGNPMRVTHRIPRAAHDRPGGE